MIAGITDDVIATASAEDLAAMLSALEHQRMLLLHGIGLTRGLLQREATPEWTIPLVNRANGTCRTRTQMNNRNRQ